MWPNLVQIVTAKHRKSRIPTLHYGVYLNLSNMLSLTTVAGFGSSSFRPRDLGRVDPRCFTGLLFLTTRCFFLEYTLVGILTRAVSRGSYAKIAKGLSSFGSRLVLLPEIGAKKEKSFRLFCSYGGE